MKWKVALIFVSLFYFFNILFQMFNLHGVIDVNFPVYHY